MGVPDNSGSLELVVGLAIERNWDDQKKDYISTCSDKDIAIFLNATELEVQAIRLRLKGPTRIERRDRACVLIESDLKVLQQLLSRSELRAWCDVWKRELDISRDNVELARQKFLTASNLEEVDVAASVYQKFGNEIWEAKQALYGAVQSIMKIRKSYRDRFGNIEAKIDEMYWKIENLHGGAGAFDDLIYGRANVREILDEVDDHDFPYVAVFS